MAHLRCLPDTKALLAANVTSQNVSRVILGSEHDFVCLREFELFWVLCVTNKLVVADLSVGFALMLLFHKLAHCDDAVVEHNQVLIGVKMELTLHWQRFLLARQ